MATNQKRNNKAKHVKPSPSQQQQQQPQLPSGIGASAPTSEQLLESLWKAIQTTNDIVGGRSEYNNNNNNRDNRNDNDANNAQCNGSVVTSFSPTGGARLQSDLWRREGNEHQAIPPPGFFNDDGWQLAPHSTVVPEAPSADDELLPPPEEFDVELAISRSSAGSSSRNDAERIAGGELPGNAILLPPPEIFDNGSLIESGDGFQVKDGVHAGVSSGKDTDSDRLDDFVCPIGRVGLEGVAVVTTDRVGTTDVTVATESVGRVNVAEKLNCLRRAEEKIEGRIIGGLLSVREICDLIENDQMCVLQGVMDGETTDRLQQKPVSVSSKTEKLELKPVSVSSNMEKFEPEPVSVFSGMDPKRVSGSVGSDVEEVDVKVKEVADAVTVETLPERNISCGAESKGAVCPSSLKVIALDASMKLQVAKKCNLERGPDGTLPSLCESVETDAEGNSLTADKKILSESKEVGVKSIPEISAHGNHATCSITTDAPNVPNSNHTLLAALGECSQDATTPRDLKVITAADSDTPSPDPDKQPPDPDKLPPYPAAVVVEESKALDGGNSEYPPASLKPGLRVDLKTALPAMNTGESKSEARVAGSVQRGARSTAAAAAAAERNPKPESVVTTHLWSDTAVARVLNVNAGISTELSNADISTNLSQAARAREIKSEVDREQNTETVQQPGKVGLKGKPSTNNGEKPGKKMTPLEKHKMEVVRIDVTESLQQTESERHFISKTVKTTMTQETRSAAVGTPLDVGMASNFGARPKAGSMFAAGSESKVELFEDGFSDAKGSNEMTGLVDELKKNRSGNAGLKETSEVVERGTGKETEVRTPGKQGSVFDMLLDQKEATSNRSSCSVFERREMSRHQTETSLTNPLPSPLGLKTSGFDASIQPSIPTVATPDARVVDKKDEVSVTKENPTAPSSSSVLLSRVTERREEIVRVPRPTSLTVRPGITPRLSNSSQQSSPTAQLNVSAQSVTSHATTSSVAAPLATPEESYDDIPYSNRSRHSSVGLSRSRQSSVGPCRSRQSSIGSLLGYQTVQSSVSSHFVVVAIDFGTTYSGYAFSFTRDPDSIHMMRRWEGGDPGIVNQKTPTTLLLTSDGKFHSFGFAARDSYHDLDPQESKKWLYFEKFKMALHHNADLNKDTTIKASNGKAYPALTVFSQALTFFKDHALQELSDQSSTTILNEDIRWVITVPAIWKAPAKQFMRQAAYQAGIASPDNPSQLLIALEPEAASIYVRKLRLYQLMPDPLMSQLTKREPTPDPLHRELTSDEEFATVDSVKYKTLPSSVSYRHSFSPSSTTASVGQEVEVEGTNYMVVDCGGGTVDITVYEMESGYGHLKELHKATGGPYGSLGIDLEFEKLLISIFGSDFIETFRTKRPAGWVDLMIAFESRKRTASPFKNNPLNVSLPFSFIDYYKKYKGGQVESAIRKYGNKEVTWSSQGMLRLTPTAMRRLFQPTLDHIKQAVGDVLNNPNTRDIKYMFLVGGFAESAILQMEMRKEFEHLLRILIPQDVGLTILKGAVCFGLDPTIVTVRRSRMTYGVGVLNRFIPDKHPRSKMIVKDGAQWCTDVFDKFVEVDQSVAVGETVVRSYTPAKAGQKSTIIHVYSSEKTSPQYITDPGVKRCGTLCLDLTDVQYRHSQKPRRREIQARMTFGDTEVKVTALDVATGKCVRAAIDFMNK